MATSHKVTIDVNGQNVEGTILESDLLSLISDALYAEDILNELYNDNIIDYIVDSANADDILEKLDADEVITYLSRTKAFKYGSIKTAIEKLGVESFNNLPIDCFDKLMKLLRLIEQGNYSALMALEL